jgi:hypothetical protein
MDAMKHEITTLLELNKRMAFNLTEVLKRVWTRHAYLIRIPMYDEFLGRLVKPIAIMQQGSRCESVRLPLDYM